MPLRRGLPLLLECSTDRMLEHFFPCFPAKRMLSSLFTLQETIYRRRSLIRFFKGTSVISRVGLLCVFVYVGFSELQLYGVRNTDMKPNFFSFVLLGTGIATTTLSLNAASAEAFLLTNTSGRWDNALLSNGYVIGSDGYAAGPWNDIVFQESGNSAQVRWGNSVNAVHKDWAFDWGDYYAGHDYEEGWYTNSHSQSVWGWHHDDQVSRYEDKSGLGFEGVSNLSIDVGEVFNIGSLTHFNQTIWLDGKDAKSADFSLDLDFGDVGLGTQTFDFSFLIDETNNNAAVCSYQTDAGKGCSDKISWDWSIDESSSFMHEGEEYTLELVGFSERVAAASTKRNFISQEDGNNSAGLFARLIAVDHSKDIPEPTSLLSLAGLGLFVAGKRKRKAV